MIEATIQAPITPYLLAARAITINTGENFIISPPRIVKNIEHTTDRADNRAMVVTCFVENLKLFLSFSFVDKIKTSLSHN